MSEVETLSSDAHGDNEADTKVPKHETQTFVNHFATNNDNKTS